MKLSQLKIDPEFQSKIPPLQFEEEQQLEQNIIAEGRLLNPIITWNGYILDGHTRYRILKKHGFIKFEVEEIQLANKYEALAWICKNQLGRRNLSPNERSFFWARSMNRPSWRWAHLSAANMEYENVVKMTTFSQNPEPVNALLPSTALEKRRCDVPKNTRRA